MRKNIQFVPFTFIVEGSLMFNYNSDKKEDQNYISTTA